MLYPDERRRELQNELLRRLVTQDRRTITVDKVAEDVIECMRREARRDVTREEKP